MPRVHEYCDWLDDYDDDAERQKKFRIKQRRRHHALMKHPMCNDPDHPGCRHCIKDIDKDDDLF